MDFSNFFQDVGALGGGNVNLTAGAEVRNVSASIPTNARAPIGAPDADTLLELGGGDLTVRAGKDINGGAYYVERGQGTLEAGGKVTTNATRSPSLGLIQDLNNPSAGQFDSNTWMPTTLFAGKSSFDVTARGDVLLGSVSNPFLLPVGHNNRYWYKTYFSTLSADSGVNATSLGGDITFRTSATTPAGQSARNILELWMERNMLLSGPASAAHYQPWLRLAESSITAFTGTLPLQAANLRATAFTGDINLAGNQTLFPSATGQVELVASGQINGLLPTGLSDVRFPGQSVQVWSSSTLNVSDADPNSIPSA